MADRTSAGVFGAIFEYLAEPGRVNKKELAEWLYDQAQPYIDFDDYQMDCNEALVKLGLRRGCPNCSNLLDDNEDLCWSCQEEAESE